MPYRKEDHCRKCRKALDTIERETGLRLCEACYRLDEIEEILKEEDSDEAEDQ